MYTGRSIVRVPLQKLVLCAVDGCGHLDGHGPAFRVALVGTDDAGGATHAAVYAARDRDHRLLHSDDYVAFLRAVIPETRIRSLHRFNVGEDCTVFDDLYACCQTYAGACARAAIDLNHGTQDIAINWSGGLHHAKESETSDLCYDHDIALAILKFLIFTAGKIINGRLHRRRLVQLHHTTLPSEHAERISSEQPRTPPSCPRSQQLSTSRQSREIAIDS
uniref:Histone deacetylase domain-containing protein n=1 Tax=Oryza punctata TaxID=4537 RepID=A0A0E0KP35_ORYPU